MGRIVLIFFSHHSYIGTCHVSVLKSLDHSLLIIYLTFWEDQSEKIEVHITIWVQVKVTFIRRMTQTTSLFKTCLLLCKRHKNRIYVIPLLKRLEEIM